MIYATGDIHGDVRRFSTDIFPEQREMTKDDYVIILGDFGLVWDWRGESKEEKHWLDWLNEKSFTTLFICGNHENFDRLYSYPVSRWNGGKVHYIRPSVIHLMRGQMFHIEGLNFFTFGGASSHDISDGVLEPDDPRVKAWKKNVHKLFRVNKRSWWKQELPSDEEMEEGLKTLEEYDNRTDFILTHCCAASTNAVIGQGVYEQDVFTRYLQRIKEENEYKKWLFGHYHINQQINDQEICLYEQIVRIH